MDGRADVTVFRPSTTSWYILKSFDNGFVGYQFGTNDGIPMAIDSNGDGAMELGMYSAGTGFWHSTGQPFFNWGYYGAGQGLPVRMLLPNY